MQSSDSSGAEIKRLVESIETTSKDVLNVQSRISQLLGTLENVKLTVSLATAAVGEKLVSLNPDTVRKEVESAKIGIAQFKRLLSEASESGKQGEGDSSLESLQKRKLNDDKRKSLFERIGGDLTIETCVQMFYDKALADSRLRGHFEKNARKMDAIKKRMREFLSTHLGGPVLYDREQLRPSHYHLNVRIFIF